MPSVETSPRPERHPLFNRAQLIANLYTILGPGGVFHETSDTFSYEYDGSFETSAPDLVVLPATTQQVAEVVKLARAHNVPIVPRGGGTGLCGGALPIRHGIVIGTSRMNRILEIDYRNRRAVVEPGVINLNLSSSTSAHGYFYAPDPSSQKISTIGGNVATNAGGPHCLAYGVTTNHVLGLEVVLPSGEIIQTGGMVLDTPGYDLTGVTVGSEGTLGIVTKVMVRLMRKPEDEQTMLAIFDTIAEASYSVSAIISAGIVPTALEMMDQIMCRAIEHHFHAGYPDNAGAVLLIEIAGISDGLRDMAERIAGICRDHGASAVRVARSAAERAALWAGRKGAAGAVGQLAPNYYIQDGVVPRTKLPQTMLRVGEISQEYGLQIANVFHAGDGNLHPLLLFDRRKTGEVERILRAGAEILKTCVDMGGTVSGEHGIGYEKREQLPLVFSTADLQAMIGLRQCFNPQELFNPDKLFPANLSCAEVSDLRLATTGRSERRVGGGRVC